MWQSNYPWLLDIDQIITVVTPCSVIHFESFNKDFSILCWYSLDFQSGSAILHVLFSYWHLTPIGVTGIICWGRRTSLDLCHVFLFYVQREGERMKLPSSISKKKKVIFFFSSALQNDFFFFSHFIFFPQESSASQSLAALSSHCTGRNGYGLYTCRSLDFEQTVWSCLGLC